MHKPFPSLQHLCLYIPLDSKYLQYFGNSYLEFEGIHLSIINNVTVRFQTQADCGTIIYVGQGPDKRDFIFMELFVMDGMLQVKL